VILNNSKSRYFSRNQRRFDDEESLDEDMSEEDIELENQHFSKFSTLRAQKLALEKELEKKNQ